MRTQQVILGEIVIDKEPIELRAELPFSEVGKKTAVLKDRLAYLLDSRFRPANPEPPNAPGLTVEEAADSLHCRCRTVLGMIKRGELHPISDEDGELYLDRAEVESIRHVRLSRTPSRIVPPK